MGGLEMEAVKISDLSFAYPESDCLALSNINLKINSGEFITLFGHSGSGKTTLLKLLKPVLAPHGSKEGRVELFGQDVYSLSHREQSEKIGFVFQDPENQIVTDKVWHELAFGLESLGIPNAEIRRRVAETASYFGIEKYFDSDINILSGGQKQVLCLASIMVMQPDILVLDEPTSMLDPIAASEFLSLIKRINTELGVTVIITEHRLEEVLPYSDRVIALENGRVISFDTPENTGKNLKDKSASFEDLPAAMRIWYAVENDLDCPVTVSQGRNWLIDYSRDHKLKELYPEDKKDNKTPAVELKSLWFRYKKHGKDIIKDLSLTVNQGEIYALTGGNGAGKSTLLSLINGVNTPYSGKIRLCSDNIATLPQNPSLILGAKTVKASLYDAFIGTDIPKDVQKSRVENAVKACSLESFTDRHPFDLSGGEAQRAAIAKLLLLKPQILLLDEPTKGLDSNLKNELANILKSLADSGATVIIVTHDIEFCAKYADRAAMLFNGEITSEGTPRQFFSTNSFYVTSAGKISRGIINGAVTAEEIIYCCTGNREDPKPPARTEFFKPDNNLKPVGEKKQKAKLPKRTTASAVMILLAIPLTIFVGTTYLDDQKYLFISLLVLLESMLPFFLIFEGRKPQARELIIISVLCAIAIAGRTLFIALPQVKPVIAIVMIAGIAFGGETGFVVGAVSMLVSNIYFGQGAWTPWQMFAAGIIGFLAGVIFKKNLLRQNTGVISVFGFIFTVVIYGGIMNFSSLILTRTPVNSGTITAFMLQGLPFDLIHAVSTLIVLFLLSKPMLEKLDRVKLKYNLIR